MTGRRTPLTAGEQFAAFLRHVAQTSDSPLGLVIERADGCTLHAAGGREFLDLLAGIGVAALGHGNRRVLDAIAEQAAKHLHIMVYGEMVQETQAALARRLAGLLPRSLDSVYFTSSGTEAIEGALKLARKATGRTRLLSFHGGFHGDTFGSLTMGGNALYKTPFEPLLGDCAQIDFNDVQALQWIDERIAAVLVEPVQAEAGVVLPAPGYLAAMRARCSEVGAMLIFDEVITGMGRTGRMFAFEHDGTAAVPDILVLAKALGGGMPLGAFISSRQRMSSLAHDPPLSHVTTFGGHPVSCAAALAALEVMIEEDLPARAGRLGTWFGERLRARLRPPHVVEVRQAGLLLGIEMASADIAAEFTRQCRSEGLLLGWTLHDDRVVRLAPPLVISEAELDDASLRMERALARVAAEEGAADRVTNGSGDKAR
ncbi:MAG TPA: aspartate aminotransferase family protein [Candidatus Limnocylindrales bacterium]|nr:aspartate aminotransferase family protein [Candidatus Limnocylindrales bacterium]